MITGICFLWKNVRNLMYSHSKIGRQYAGKVRQVISGSVGFDDFEWGVTLFADDVLQFKKLIYEMRFDEVSARYGEFGTFFVGNILPNEKVTNFYTYNIKKERNSFLFLLPSIFTCKNLLFSANLNKNRQILFKFLVRL